MGSAGANQIVDDFPPFFRRYASDHVVRLKGTTTIPASLNLATGVISKDVAVDPRTGVSARLYLPSVDSAYGKLPVLVYYHGGGFCIESAFSPTYHHFLNSLAAAAGLLIVSVDYRRAPEHLLPAAYNDSLAAFTWVFSPAAHPWVTEHGDLTRVYLAGDGAGANIAHQMAIRFTSACNGVVKKLAGVVLIHPFFWGSDAIAPTLDDRKRIERLWRAASKAGVGLDHPWFNPPAESMVGLGSRRVLVAVAEEDALAERGRLYCKRLKGSGWGGEVDLVTSPGVGHLFHLRQPECREAAELMEKVVAFFDY